MSADNTLIFYNDLDLDIKVTSTGDISSVYNADSIKQSLSMIVDTARGSRIFFPLFGCRIRSFLFEPLDEEISRRIGEELQTTITSYERRISILSIDISIDFEKAGYTIDIIYKVNTTNEVDTYNVVLEKL